MLLLAMLVGLGSLLIPWTSSPVARNKQLPVKTGDSASELRLQDARVTEGPAGTADTAAKLAAAKAERANLLERYYERHPRVLAQQQIIDELEAQLAQMENGPNSGRAVP